MGRLLLVEDEGLIQSYWEEIAKESGYQDITLAETVEEALASLKTGNYNIAILDVLLHKESSDAVAERLTELAIPTVITTGTMRESLPESFKRHHYLPKPFSFNAGLDALEALSSN
jgi:DNA-binding response OmpR family regulator